MDIQAKIKQKAEGRRLEIILSSEALEKLRSGEEIYVDSYEGAEFGDKIKERDERGELLAIVKISIIVSDEVQEVEEL